MLETTTTATDTKFWKARGFDRNPFTLGDSNELFMCSTWEEYLDLLPQFVRFCNSLLLVMGAPGVGKTTLLRQFIAHDSEHRQTLFIKAQDCPTIEQLLTLLHQQYDAPLSTEDDTIPTLQLDAQLYYLQHHKKPRLLVIDNAEQMSLSLRQACLQIVQQQSVVNTCLPVVLLGQPVLKEQFNALLTPTTAKECLHYLRVAPFDREQTRHYLLWCCKVAGHHGKTAPLTDTDIDAIYRASQGVLSHINAEAIKHFEQQPNAQHFALSAPARKKLYWWGGVLVAIAALLWLYKWISEPTPIAITPSVSMHTTTAVPPQSTAPSATTQQNSATQVGDAVIKNDAVTPNTATPKPAAVTPTPVPEHAPDAPGVQTPAPVGAPATAPNASPAIAPSTPAPTATAAPAPAIPAATPAPTVTPSMTLKEKTKPAARAQKTAPRQHATKTHRAPVFEQVMSEKLRAQQQRIRAMNPAHYTLQLIAVTNVRDAQKFILAHNIEETALIALTQRDGKDWYIVIDGAFPTAAAAKQNAALLGPKLKQVKPWPRTYKSIQLLLKREPHAN